MVSSSWKWSTRLLLLLFSAGLVVRIDGITNILIGSEIVQVKNVYHDINGLVMNEEMEQMRLDIIEFQSLYGVIVKPTTKEVVWLTETCNKSTRLSRNNNCDFFLPNIQTFHSIKNHPICGKYSGVSFSLDPWDKFNVWGPYFKKVYYPKACESTLEYSIAGAILKNVDLDLKSLVNNTDGIADGIEGFHTVRWYMDQFPMVTELMTRLWVDVEMNQNTTEDGSIVNFFNVTVRVNAANIHRDTSSDSGVSDYGELHPAYQMFVNNTNRLMPEIMKKIKSFRQFGQLAVAQEAMKFVHLKEGVLSREYLESLEFELLNVAKRVPAVIIDEKRERFLQGIVYWNQSFDQYVGDNFSYIKDYSAFDRQIIPYNNPKYQFNCSFSDKNVFNKLSDFQSLFDQSDLLSCQLVDGTKSSSRPLEFDHCSDALHYWDTEEERYIGIASSALTSKISSSAWYNTSGIALPLKWNCQNGTAVPIDFHVIESLLNDTIVIIKLRSRPCNMNLILFALRFYGAVGTIFITDSVVLPNIVIPNFLDSKFDYDIPIRLVRKEIGNALLTEVRRSNVSLTMHMSCGFEPWKPPIEELFYKLTYLHNTYYTLDMTAINANHSGCQKEFLEMSKYHELVPPTFDILRNVVMKFPWSSKHVILSDGHAYGTALSVAPGSRLTFIPVLDSSENRYRSHYCPARILVRTQAKQITHSGFIYRTLDTVRINSTEAECQFDPLPLPDDWEIAPPTSDIIRNVVGKYNWGCHALILNDGMGYCTLLKGEFSGQLCSRNNLLHLHNNSEYSSKCLWISRILIRQELSLKDYEQELQVGDKRKISDSIRMTLHQLPPMVATVNNMTLNSSNLFAVSINLHRSYLVHGGADMSNVRVKNNGKIPIEIERQLNDMLASGWTFFTKILDTLTGTKYTAQSTSDQMFTKENGTWQFAEQFTESAKNWFYPTTVPASAPRFSSPAFASSPTPTATSHPFQSSHNWFYSSSSAASSPWFSVPTSSPTPATSSGSNNEASEGNNPSNPSNDAPYYHITIILFLLGACFPILSAKVHWLIYRKSDKEEVDDVEEDGMLGSCGYATKGDVKRVHAYLQEYPQNINKQDHTWFDFSALHHACRWGHYDVCSWLIGAGADINLRDKNGWTPLHLVVRFGHDRICSLLLSKGADTTISNNSGNAVFQVACSSGNISCLEILMCHGVNVNIFNQNGEMPVTVQNNIKQVCQIVSAAINPKRKTSSLCLHVCGDGNTGKSTLCVALKTAFVSYFPSMASTVRLSCVEDRTIGMVKDVVNVPSQKLQFILHDYGGQPKFVANHATFLSQSENSLFVLVIPLADVASTRRPSTHSDVHILSVVDKWFIYLSAITREQLYRPTVVVLLNFVSLVKDRHYQKMVQEKVSDLMTQWSGKFHFVQADNTIVPLMINVNSPKAVSSALCPLLMKSIQRLEMTSANAKCIDAIEKSMSKWNLVDRIMTTESRIKKLISDILLVIHKVSVFLVSLRFCVDYQMMSSHCYTILVVVMKVRLRRC